MRKQVWLENRVLRAFHIYVEVFKPHTKAIRFGLMMDDKIILNIA
jgi:hypothetical protein